MSLYTEIIKDGPLAYWRMEDAPFDETISRYNICPNPSVEVDTTGFSTQRYGSNVNNAAWAGSRQTGGGWNGAAYYRATATAAWSFKSWVTMPEATAVVGKSYVVSFYVRTSRTMDLTANVESVRSDGSVVGLVVGTATSVPANTWTRLSQIHTVPASGARLRGVVVAETLNNGDRIEVDGILYEQTTTVGTWFDGSSAGSVWLGTAGKSASRNDVVITRRYFKDNNDIYNGDYSATGVTYNVSTFKQVTGKAATFAPAGSASVTGGNGIWDLFGTQQGQWTIEFLARFDDDNGGTLVSTDKWKIATVDAGSIGFMAAGASSGWQVPAPWQDNQWHHYAFSFENGLLTLYVDGADVNAFASTNFDASGSGALVFAPGNTAVTLDEVAVYPRGLDDGRISAHWFAMDSALGEVVTSVYVEPRQTVLTLIKGATIVQQMTVTIQYSGGGVATPLNVVWSTSDGTVATVSSTGLVRALKAGSAGITATLPDLGETAFTAVSVLPPEPLPGEDRAIYSKDSETFVYDDDFNLKATTEEYWEVDPGRLVRGEWIYDNPVSLATLGYNISTLAGREGIPVSDGENIRISTRAGRRWVPKTPDQKQLSLAMWVQGSNEDGTVPKDVYLRTKFWENYNMLKQLFAVWDRQILLRRRMPTRYGVMVMQTWVEPISTMDLNPTGPMRATFTIDLVMNDPFWRAEEQSSDPVVVRTPGGQRRYPRTYPLTYGQFGNNGIFTLFNDGTHDAKLIVEIHGQVQNPTLLNMDTNERFRLVNDVELGNGDVIEVNFSSRTIQLKGTGSRYWWLDRTTDWLHARPGYQRFQFSHEGYDEDAYVVWRWEPAYL